MQGVILAAGKGIRLNPITEEIPKPMVEINGVSLIHRTLTNMKAIGITEVLIVTGYLEDKLKSHVGDTYEGMNIVYISNPDYAVSNNIYSLYLTKNYIKKDILLAEGDILFPEHLLQAFQNRIEDCIMMTSPYEPEKMDGTIVFADEGKVKQLLTKGEQQEQLDYSQAYKTVNLYRFGKTFLKQVYFPEMEAYMRKFGRNQYYEAVLGTILRKKTGTICMELVLSEDWLEIDTVQEYEHAKKVWHS